MRTSRFVAALAAVLVSASVQASGPCDEFARKLPNVKRSLCEAARLEASAARSVKGQPLWVRNFPTPHWERDAKVYWLDAEMRQMWLDLLRWMSERMDSACPDSLCGWDVQQNQALALI